MGKIALVLAALAGSAHASAFTPERWAVTTCAAKSVGDVWRNTHGLDERQIYKRHAFQCARAQADLASTIGDAAARNEARIDLKLMRLDDGNREWYADRFGKPPE